MDVLFYFEQVQRFKNRGDVQFWGFQLLCKQGSFVVSGVEYLYSWQVKGVTIV